MSEASSAPSSSLLPLIDRQSSPDTVPTFRNPMSTLQRLRDRTITTIPSTTPQTRSPTRTVSQRRANGLTTQARRRNAQCPTGERLRTRPCVERGVAQPTDKEDSSTTSSPSPSEKVARGEETSAWLMDQASSSGPWSLPVAVLDSQSNDYPLTLDERLSSGGGPAVDTPPSMAGERQG